MSESLGGQSERVQREEHALGVIATLGTARFSYSDDYGRLLGLIQLLREHVPPAANGLMRRFPGQSTAQFIKYGEDMMPLDTSSVSGIDAYARWLMRGSDPLLVTTKLPTGKGYVAIHSSPARRVVGAYELSSYGPEPVRQWLVGYTGKVSCYFGSAMSTVEFRVDGESTVRNETGGPWFHHDALSPEESNVWNHYGLAGVVRHHVHALARDVVVAAGLRPPGNGAG